MTVANVPLVHSCFSYTSYDSSIVVHTKETQVDHVHTVQCHHGFCIVSEYQKPQRLHCGKRLLLACCLDPIFYLCSKAIALVQLLIAFALHCHKIQVLAWLNALQYRALCPSICNDMKAAPDPLQARTAGTDWSQRGGLLPPSKKRWTGETRAVSGVLFVLACHGLLWKGTSKELLLINDLAALLLRLNSYMSTCQLYLSIYRTLNAVVSETTAKHSLHRKLSSS